MPAVTVVTAVHNGARYLSATIESIRAQTATDWEYILVDDASTDESGAIIQRFVDLDERIHLIRRTMQGGPFAAANSGLARATGTFIVRTDADDLSLPHRIERQVQFLDSHPPLSACATFCQNLNDNGPMAGYYNVAPLTSGTLKWYLAVRCPLVHSSACIRRDALLAIGGYRELPVAQDYRLWCELARAGWLGVVPEVLVQFRVHDRRITMTHGSQQDALGREILREHIAHLTGAVWTQNEAAALWAVGLAKPFPIPDALMALARWDSFWLADPSLTTAERIELAGLSAFRRRKFLRCNAKQQPGRFVRHIARYLAPAPAAPGRSVISGVVKPARE